MAANVPIVFNEALNVSLVERQPMHLLLGGSGPLGCTGLYVREHVGSTDKIPHNSVGFFGHHHALRFLLHVTTLRTRTCYMRSELGLLFHWSCLTRLDINFAETFDPSMRPER
jgi:hypothetical protein